MATIFTFNLYYTSFDVSVTGLKPTTQHNFFLNDQNFTSVCEQDGKTLGGGLMTDEEGALAFEAHVPDTYVMSMFDSRGKPSLIGDYSWPARVESPDGKSKAEIVVRGELFYDPDDGGGDDKPPTFR
jgi:hypothetical protein